eukprot:TRINITY_DN57416_c0_g1_i1.p1 TRINITY_DN57416_c0_g1~~TRINITY_DN57416_c0_g1_i1.p1  ORF type:complete len:247 (-),score=45.67 TRINITY_DN57416_c0_g1_i1:5-745(-)
MTGSTGQLGLLSLPLDIAKLLKYQPGDKDVQKEVAGTSAFERSLYILKASGKILRHAFKSQPRVITVCRPELGYIQEDQLQVLVMRGTSVGELKNVLQAKLGLASERQVLFRSLSDAPMEDPSEQLCCDKDDFLYLRLLRTPAAGIKCCRWLADVHGLRIISPATASQPMQQWNVTDLSGDTRMDEVLAKIDKVYYKPWCLENAGEALPAWCTVTAADIEFGSKLILRKVVDGVQCLPAPESLSPM